MQYTKLLFLQTEAFDQFNDDQNVLTYIHPCCRGLRELMVWKCLRLQMFGIY